MVDNWTSTDYDIAEEVMGWTLISSYRGYGGSISRDPVVTDDAERKLSSYNDGWRWRGWRSSRSSWEWEPSSKMDHAWLVLERMKTFDGSERFFKGLGRIVGMEKKEACEFICKRALAFVRGEENG